MTDKRLAVIADIHGNLAALEAVFSAIDHSGCDETWCLGDLVGHPGADALSCVELVAARCEIVLKGNHDAGAVGEAPLSSFAWAPAAVEGIKRVRAELDCHPDGARHRGYLELLEPIAEIPSAGGAIVLVHAGPLSPLWEMIVSDDDYETSHAATAKAPLLLGGHTHRASWAVRRDHAFISSRVHGEDILELCPGEWAYANPGSVGARPALRRARWAILVIAQGIPTAVEWRETPY